METLDQVYDSMAAGGVASSDKSPDKDDKDSVKSDNASCDKEPEGSTAMEFGVCTLKIPFPIYP